MNYILVLNLVLIAAAIVFFWGMCCWWCCSQINCIDAIIPSSVAALPRKLMAKRRRAAALAGMDFDTCQGGGGGGCAICLGEYAIGERRATISDCKHRFHAQCIETWMEYHTTCPLCRHNLV